MTTTYSNTPARAAGGEESSSCDCVVDFLCLAALPPRQRLHEQLLRAYHAALAHLGPLGEGGLDATLRRLRDPAMLRRCLAAAPSRVRVDERES